MASTRHRQASRRRVFLLSPADCGAARARQVANPTATFDLAVRLRAPVGVPLGELFSFLSGLYFRGKLAYARAFAAASPAANAIRVITAGDGLVPPDQHVGLADLQRYAAVPIAVDESRYRLPLERDLGLLTERLDSDCQVILLGSIATNKYVEILSATLGTRLHVPRQLIGLGDMSRGSLLLRCAAEGRELDYVRIDQRPRRKR